MTTREIVETFQEMYGAEVSPTLVSRVTDAVIEQVIEWQARPLDEVYAIVYLDCLVVKIRQDKRVINKAIYLALGVNMEGHKELLGLWISENEGAKFWLNVLTTYSLSFRTEAYRTSSLLVWMGLKAFLMRLMPSIPRHRFSYASCIWCATHSSTWSVTADLKSIYQSATEEDALLALNQFAERWGDKYPKISISWRSHWDNLNTLFKYPQDIRKAIYTTNARKAIKKRKLFPSDEAATKVVYLAITAASKKWTMPIRNWKAALNRFIIEFEDRLENYI